jgi:hypothetical protein
MSVASVRRVPPKGPLGPACLCPRLIRAGLWIKITSRVDLSSMPVLADPGLLCTLVCYKHGGPPDLSTRSRWYEVGFVRYFLNNHISTVSTNQ